MLNILKKSDFELIYEIMQESFPFDEIRTYDKQKELMSHENYKILVMQKDDEIYGFIAIWDFENFIFLEHFAVSKNHRNKGLGEKFLIELKKYSEKKYNDEISYKKIILEVEYPENDNSLRRIDFYKRNGFDVFDFNYIMPPFSKEHKPVPLLLMSNLMLLQSDFDDFYDKITKIINI